MCGVVNGLRPQTGYVMETDGVEFIFRENAGRLGPLFGIGFPFDVAGLGINLKLERDIGDALWDGIPVPALHLLLEKHILLLLVWFERHCGIAVTGNIKYYLRCKRRVSIER